MISVSDYPIDKFSAFFEMCEADQNHLEIVKARIYTRPLNEPKAQAKDCESAQVLFEEDFGEHTIAEFQGIEYQAALEKARALNKQAASEWLKAKMKTFRRA